MARLHSPDSPDNVNGTLQLRSEIDPRCAWNLQDLYESIGEWEEDFARIPALTDELVSWKGRLGESADNLLGCLRTSDRLDEMFHRLYVYAHLLRDQDTENPDAQALADRITSLATTVSEAGSFLSPEILEIEEETVGHYLEESEELRVYRHSLEDTMRMRAHTLSPKEEKILALSGNMASGAKNIFNMLNNADMRFPVIKDEEGNDVELTKGRYSRFMESADRRVRKDAYDAFLKTYKKYVNTLAASLNASVNKDIFYSRARGYASCLERALDANNLPVEAYETVLQVVGENTAPLRRYLEIRKRIMGLDTLHPWDLFVPLFPDVDEKIPYADALRIVREGLAPLGPEYGEVLEKAFSSGWIDVYENRGKRSGAYSWGAYGCHPYVLLNYQETMNDVFTIAHELGHSLHSYYTSRVQPFVYGSYSIFTAEVASTTNESLLMNYLLRSTTDRRKKLYLLNQYLDQIRGTVFTQVLFAEFEKRIHEIAERGDPLTSDTMSTVYREIFESAYGESVARDEDDNIYWVRIPHFYTAYYVYQYATGYAAASALSRKILVDGEGAVGKYLGFLKAGSSKYSIDILRDAGVDMTRPEPVEETVRLFNDLLDQMEELL